MANATDSIHPDYKDKQEDAKKWRLTATGGSKYKDEYLTQRPNEKDFSTRADISYIPAFAKEAVLEIARAIHQRMPRVSRTGGTSTFLDVAKGELGGVDRKNSSMNSFVSRNCVNELCFMGRVAICVDNVIPAGPTKADLKATDHPYIYAYAWEDIRDWAYSSIDPARLKYIILREKVDIFDEIGYRTEQKERFRRYFDDETGGVTVEFVNDAGESITPDNQPGGAPTTLLVSRIPVVIADLGMSLLEDVVDHQISLMNLASMDMSYAIRSNIPFYVEQRDNYNSDAFTQLSYRLPKDSQGNPVNPEDLTEDSRKQFIRDRDQLAVGATIGRYYAKDMNQPNFINPSSEPLEASMKKQDQIKSEIRDLVSLSVKSLGNKFQSEMAKNIDQRPMEAGLSYIGLILEATENEVSSIWAEYETKDKSVVKYPEQYNLLSESERQDQIKQDAALMSVVPSQTFRREMQKNIVHTKFGHLLDPSIVAIMDQEIESTNAPTSDPLELRSDVEAGLVSAEYASNVRGYPAGEAAKAQVEKANRLNVQTQLQSAAHVNPDAQPQGAGKAEKAVVNNPDVNLADQTRGKGK